MDAETRPLFDPAWLADPDELHPTEYAQRSLAALFDAATVDPRRGAQIAASDDGSVEVYWRVGAKRLHLTYPADATKRPYLYRRTGELGELLEDATPDMLVTWLRWLRT